MTSLDTLDIRIDEFKKDIINNTPLDIVRKHIIFGSCAEITKEQYFNLRSEVASKFKIHPNEVLVVGSAKLGFSIAPKKTFRRFSDSSDVDLAIISSELFNVFWKEVFSFWEQNGYWDKFDDFNRYLLRGWIRPDKFPSSKSFQRSSEWWEFFKSLSGDRRYSSYKIVGAIYRDWHFLESYQMQSVKKCKLQLELEETTNGY